MIHVKENIRKHKNRIIATVIGLGMINGAVLLQDHNYTRKMEPMNISPYKEILALESEAHQQYTTERQAYDTSCEVLRSSFTPSQELRETMIKLETLVNENDIALAQADSIYHHLPQPDGFDLGPLLLGIPGSIILIGAYTYTRKKCDDD